MLSIKTRAVMLAACGALAVTGVADASAPAKTKVTIEVSANGYFSGTVKSPKPHRCADGRKITLYKQVGAKQQPSVDAVIAYDTSELHGRRGVWSTGNIGGGSGKFYARAARRTGCKAASSRTVNVQIQ
jgi:hypothetical protein